MPHLGGGGVLRRNTVCFFDIVRLNLTEVQSGAKSEP